MFTRVYAMWGRARSVYLLLATVITLLAAGLFYSTAKFILPVSTAHERGYNHSGCMLFFPNRLGWIDEVVLIASESIVVCLLLRRRWQVRPSHSLLLETLYNDGVLYFVFVLVASITSLFVICLAPPNLLFFTMNMQAALHSILCNRFLLRLRECAASGDAEMPEHLSAMEFQLNPTAYTTRIGSLPEC